MKGPTAAAGCTRFLDLFESEMPALHKRYAATLWRPAARSALPLAQVMRDNAGDPEHQPVRQARVLG